MFYNFLFQSLIFARQNAKQEDEASAPSPCFSGSAGCGSVSFFKSQQAADQPFRAPSARLSARKRISSGYHWSLFLL